MTIVNVSLPNNLNNSPAVQRTVASTPQTIQDEAFPKTFHSGPNLHTEPLPQTPTPSVATPEAVLSGFNLQSFKEHYCPQTAQRQSFSTSQHSSTPGTPQYTTDSDRESTPTSSARSERSHCINSKVSWQSNTRKYLLKIVTKSEIS